MKTANSSISFPSFCRQRLHHMSQVHYIGHLIWLTPIALSHYITLVTTVTLGHWVIQHDWQWCYYATFITEVMWHVIFFVVIFQTAWSWVAPSLNGCLWLGPSVYFWCSMAFDVWCSMFDISSYIWTDGIAEPLDLQLLKHNQSSEGEAAPFKR